MFIVCSDCGESFEGSVLPYYWSNKEGKNFCDLCTKINIATKLVDSLMRDLSSAEVLLEGLWSARNERKKK